MTHDITTLDDLRKVYKRPKDIAVKKQISLIDPHAKAFIALSPFLIISSNDGAGHADASPKGEAPGFVKVLDAQALLIPDRPGNNRLDTLENIVKNPGIGLIFMVPGMNETLRINGKASLSTDPDLLELCIAQKKLPLSVIKVAVEAVYMHCAKAFIRSKLWDPEAQIDRASFPSLGKIIKDQLDLKLPTGALDIAIKASDKSKLY